MLYSTNGLKWIPIKFAGFVDESLQIETNQTFLNFYFLFLQNESTNWIIMDQTCESGFVRIWDLHIQIFKDSVCAIVLKICEDLLDLWKQVKSLNIFWICDHQSNPRTKSFQNSKDLDLRTFLDSRFVIAIRYKSMDSWDKCMCTWLPDTNPATLIPIHFDGSQTLICCWRYC